MAQSKHQSCPMTGPGRLPTDLPGGNHFIWADVARSTGGRDTVRR